jgi:hypothetical protein
MWNDSLAFRFGLLNSFSSMIYFVSFMVAQIVLQSLSTKRFPTVILYKCFPTVPFHKMLSRFRLGNVVTTSR